MIENVDMIVKERVLYPEKLYERTLCSSLIYQSLEASHKEFIEKEPLVILDLKGTNYSGHETYFIDTNGVAWLSKGSERVIVESLFNQYQFGYDVWSRWIRKKSGLNGTVMPYVNGNQVYLVIPYTENKNRRRRTWLNLSKCQEIRIDGLPITGPIPKQAREIVFCYPGFKVIYTTRLCLILKQLKLAKVLVNQWHQYYLAQMERLNYQWTIHYPGDNGCLKHVQPYENEKLNKMTADDYHIFLSISAVREFYEGTMNLTNRKRHELLDGTDYARKNINELVQAQRDNQL